MGWIRNLAESFHEFATNYVEKEYGPGVASDAGYDRSTKLSLLLLKEEINKPWSDVGHFTLLYTLLASRCSN